MNQSIKIVGGGIAGLSCAITLRLLGHEIPVDSVREFDDSLDTLGIENEIYVYPGLGHAFANPSNPGHDPESTEDAWMKTVAFLDKHLR